MKNLRAIWITASALLVCMAFVNPDYPPVLTETPKPEVLPFTATVKAVDEDSMDIQVKMGTYLGNWQRNYYGNKAPDTLSIIWKHELGEGETFISPSIGRKLWRGAGWTGQPLLVEEKGVDYLIQGAYDHHLKKIKAATGELVWEYPFDDVLKGTGTIWENKHGKTPEERVIILQGSRRGLNKHLYSRQTTSFQAVSYMGGSSLWKMNVRRGPSYSRDVDASAMILNDTAYIGLENGFFTVFDPSPSNSWMHDGLIQPQILQELPLFDSVDITRHYGNLVVEASPCLLDGKIYVSAGSGHVYGYDLQSRELVWDFYIGSDLDGTPVVTEDGCLLVSVEKQYISGQGGVFKLNPKLPPEEAVEWYFPTQSRALASWRGGVIGSPAVNDLYRTPRIPHLAAFIGIDGYLYVVDQRKTEFVRKTLGPSNESLYDQPHVYLKKYIGPSISTPIFIDNKLIAAGYHGMYLFEFNDSLQFKQLSHFREEFESTPIAYDNKVYIASRNGYLYCLGRRQ